MGWLSRGNKDEQKSNQNTEDGNGAEELDEVAIVIHYTPHRTYVYISESNNIDSNAEQSNVELWKNNICFEVSGNYTLINNIPREDKDNILELMQVYQLDVPVVKILVD